MKFGVVSSTYRAEELQKREGKEERGGKSYATVARCWVIKEPGFLKLWTQIS